MATLTEYLDQLGTSMDPGSASSAYSFPSMSLAFDYQDALDEESDLRSKAAKASDEEKTALLEKAGAARQRGRAALLTAEEQQKTEQKDQRTSDLLTSLMNAGLSLGAPVPGSYGAFGPQLANAGQTGISTYLALSKDRQADTRETRLARAAQTRALQGGERNQMSAARLGMAARKGQLVWTQSEQPGMVRGYRVLGDGTRVPEVDDRGQQVLIPRGMIPLYAEQGIELALPTTSGPVTMPTGLTPSTLGERPSNVPIPGRGTFRVMPGAGGPPQAQQIQGLPLPPEDTPHNFETEPDPLALFRKKGSYLDSSLSGFALKKADEILARMREQSGGQIPQRDIDRLKKELKDREDSPEGKAWNDPHGGPYLRAQEAANRAAEPQPMTTPGAAPQIGTSFKDLPLDNQKSLLEALDGYKSDGKFANGKELYQFLLANHYADDKARELVEAYIAHAKQKK